MKITAKRIALIVVAFILAAVMIAGNIVLSVHAQEIHDFFGNSGSGNYTSEESEKVAQEGDKLIQTMAEDSMVLLKNDNDTLPLDKEKDNRVNLFGWNSTDAGFMLVGGGSGGTTLKEDVTVTLQDALTDAGISYNTYLASAYAAVSSNDADDNNVSDSTYVMQNPGASFYTDDLMQSARNYSDTAIIVLGRWGEENGVGGASELYVMNGYINGKYLELTENEKIIFEKVQEYDFENVIVLLNFTNNMECGFLDDYDVDAAIYVGMPGQSGARAIPRIIYGDVTPSGRTPDTYAYDYQTNNPVMANPYYSGNVVTYAEGIYFGYRWYETADAEGYFDEVSNQYGKGYDGVVQFPFGYGLSYADFKWEVTWPEDTVLTQDGEYKVEVRVTNCGDETGNTFSGKDVVQLYVTAPYYEGGIEKAHVTLVAYAKTATLAPGQSQVVPLEFSAYDLASYDSYDANANDHTGYELDAGKYELKLMDNSHEISSKVVADQSAVCEFNAASDINFDNDPVTGNEVVNRFTGENAYAGVPADGTAASTKEQVDAIYMSRANDFADFPVSRATVNDNTVGNGYVYTYPQEEVAEASAYSYGVDAGMYLMTLADGSKATYADLNGDSGKALSYNRELMEKLWDYNSEDWDKFLDQMTWDEIVKLISQAGFHTEAIESIGKQRNVDRDGPAGFNTSVGGSHPNTQGWVAYPSETLLACSFNPELAYDMGLSQGAIANATGLSGWYAPGLNLHRSPYNSRNFEYYSEDPVLSGTMAAEVIRGAKQNNLYVYMKHFGAECSGKNSYNWNTWLTEQALREVYLKGFEIATKEGGANAVMSAFSNIGNVWAGGNHALLNDILRGEWGFNGSIITDYYQSSYMDGKQGVMAGNDLWLNRTNGMPASSLSQSDNGNAYAARLAAKNIIYTLIDTYMTAYTYQQSGGTDDRYNVSIDTFVPTQATFSPLFVGLWVGVNVILVAGMAVCVVFIFKKPKEKKPSEA